MTDFPVAAVERLDLAFTPKPWPFAQMRREQIAAHFAALRSERPAIYNGPVLLMHQWSLAGPVLSGHYLQTDFSSFIAWRDWDFPDPSVKNCFALGALRGNDGAFVLGVMGAHTAGAGRIYFPGGTPDPSDIVHGRVDLEGSVRREVAEETGLAASEFEIDPGWTAILAGPRIALVKTMQASEPAQSLHDRILRHLADETEPELAGVHLVRGPSDLHPMMPAFVPAFFNYVWMRERSPDARKPTTP
jgi:8-oxo-dGTP pyrophosphatase MutT (NUDIX family)